MRPKQDLEARSRSRFRRCQYAERFGDGWMALSAKYGFIAPDFIIAELFEVPFKRGTSQSLPKQPSPLPKRRHHLR
jgi:hypothetical protein